MPNISFQSPAGTRKALRERAKAEGVSVSDIIRRFIAEGLAKTSSQVAQPK